jgi:hypothetical protein
MGILEGRSMVPFVWESKEMIHLGYTKIMEVKLTRTKHLIAFRPGIRKIDFMAMLEKVPDEARITEIIDMADDMETSKIEFMDEKEH